MGNRRLLLGNRWRLAGNRRRLVGSRRRLAGNQRQLKGNRRQLEGNLRRWVGNRWGLEGNHLDLWVASDTIKNSWYRTLQLFFFFELKTSWAHSLPAPPRLDLTVWRSYNGRGGVGAPRSDWSTVNPERVMPPLLQRHAWVPGALYFQMAP